MLKEAGQIHERSIEYVKYITSDEHLLLSIGLKAAENKKKEMKSLNLND